MKVLNLSYHPLDARSGKWVDLSRKGNHGTPYGGARPYMIAPRIVGYWFDGSSGCVSCGNRASLRPDDAVTVAGWIFSQSQSNQEIINYRIDGTGPYWIYQIHQDDAKITLYDGTDDGLAKTISYTLPENKWSYAVLTFSRAKQELRYYVNIILRGTAATGDYPLYTHCAPENSNCNLKGLFLGSAKENLRPFKGFIFQPVIEDRAWPLDEVRENYYRSSIYRILRGLPHSMIYTRVPWKQRGGIYVL